MRWGAFYISPPFKEASDVATGRVKWFNSAKGYGYIEDGSSGVDVYVHVASVDGDETLRENIIVHYDLIETRYGLEAMRVRVQEHCW